MSDASREESGGDTTLEMSKDDDESDHSFENSGRRDASSRPFSDQDGGSDKTPIKPHRAYNNKEPADPVKVLQLSQQCYVADTLEDDEEEDVSMMIPPTQSDETAPFIIPNTPEKDDPVLMEEDNPTVSETKKDPERESETDDIWNRPTQPLIPLAEEIEESDGDETYADTDAMFEKLCDAPTQKYPTSPGESKSEKQTEEGRNAEDAEEEDDDWNLRLTDTQATQAENLDPVGDEAVDKTASLCDDSLSIIETSKIDDESPKKTSEPKPDDDTEKLLEKTVHEIEESDDEIEPSQPCSKSLEVRREVVQKVAEDVPSMKDPINVSVQPEVHSTPVKGVVSKAEVDVKSVEPVPEKKEVETKKVTEKREESTTVKEAKHSTSSSSDSPHLNDTLKEGKKSENADDSETQSLPETALSSCKDSESDVIRKSSSSSISSEVEPMVSSAQMLPPSSVHKKHLRWSHTPRRNAVAAGEKLADVTSKLEYKFDDDKEVPVDRVEPSCVTFSNHKRLLGTFTDAESLAKQLKSVGVSISNEKLKSVVNAPNHSSKKVLLRSRIIYQISMSGNDIYEEFIVPNEEEGGFSSHLLPQFSPISSSSTTTSTSTKGSSFVSTASGELGDISSSLSSKSGTSSSTAAAAGEGRTQGTQTTLSQASMDVAGVRTSTQTEGAVSFANFDLFKLGAIGSDSKDSSQDDFQNVTPVKREQIKSETKDVEEDEDDGVKPKQKRSASRKRPAKRGAAGESSESDVKVPTKKLLKPDSSDSDKPAKKSPAKKPASEVKRRGGRKKATEPAVVKKEETIIPPVPIIEEDSSSDPAPFGNILPGVRVMARWKDGYYYSGVVQCEEADGRWRVQFDDEASRVVSRENLLKISVLQVGTQVLAQSPDGYFDPGVVSSHYREGKEFGYIIEQSDGLTQKYPRHSVILSTEQAKMITDNRPVVPASLTINLDNIVGGKRKRKSSQTPEAENPVVQKTARSSRRRRAPDSNLDTTESSESGVPSQKSLVEKVKRELKAEVTPPQKQPQAKKTRGKKAQKTQKKGSEQAKSADDENEVADDPEDSTESEISGASGGGSTKGGERRNAQATEKGEEDEISQPLTSLTRGAGHSRGNKMFHECAFLLSHAPRSVDENASFTRGDDMKGESVRPFDKEHLCGVIINSGGTVLDSFEEAQKCGKKKLFLLANTFLRTKKYIQCVAGNIPCVQHYWIQICNLTGRFLQYTPYLLPTGYSIVKEENIPWHNKTNIFEGLKIVVMSEKKTEFVDIWTSVLLAANADLVQKYNLPAFSVPGKPYHVNLIVTDSTCPSKVVSAARRRKIPVVSSEWIIQSVIIGEKLPYDAHPKFKHDYKE